MAEFAEPARKILLQIAKDTIKYFLTEHKLPSFNLNDFPEQLRQTRACFVTLHLHGQLRGCIGSLTAHQALIIDVCQNAYNAAFQDPRFKLVTLEEFDQLTLDISILSVPQKMYFSSEAELIKQLRPGIDGLILSDIGHRGTFLPSVWEQLPDPAEFLAHLKAKAGLPTNYWSSTLVVEHYTAELIS